MTRPSIASVLVSLVVVSNFLCLVIPFIVSAVSDDYTFGSETVNYGYVTDVANRNAEDGSYESMIESDQYSDDNFSGTTESIIIGSGSGSSFPSALDSNDDNYRYYAEASTAPADTVKCIRPSADTQKQWDGQTPGSSTTHYDLLDETTEGGNGFVDTVNTNTTSDKDIYAMTDPSFSGSPSYDIRAWVIACKVGGTQSMNLNFGIRIGSTDYSAYSGNLVRDTFTNYSKGWTTDPSDSGEWTLTDLQGLSTYITTSDCSPVPYVTQIGIKIWANYTATYEEDVQIEYTSVSSTSQTTGFMVYCRARVQAGSEYFDVYAWDYTSSAWSTEAKTTISAGSETDYSFSLASTERDSVNNKVKLRIVDADGGTGDTEQGQVGLDVFIPNRIELGYDVEVDLTASGIPGHGDLWLRVKGKTSAETIDIKLWNYSASAWTTAVISVTATSNTWYTYNFTEAYFLSASQVKIRISGATAASSDTTKDTFSLDVAFVTHELQDPYMAQIEDWPDPCAQFQTGRFNMTYWDADNQLPSSGYPKINISLDVYVMSEVSAGDPDTYDGKYYYYETSSLAVGVHNWNITIKDADSAEVFSATYTITIEASSHLNHIWDGEAGDELASTPENWNSDLVPEDYDSVTWETTGTGNCRWDIVGLVVNFWNMTGTYDGELYVAEDVGIVYDLTQSSTSCYLYGGSATISIGYNWTSYYFYGNSSTVELTGTGSVYMRNNVANRFYNLALAYTGQTTTLTATYLYVSRNLDLNGGMLDLGANYILISDTATYSDFDITGQGTIDETTGALGASVLMTLAGNRYKNFSSSVTVPGFRWTNNQVGTSTLTLSADTYFSGNWWVVDAALKHYIFDTGGYDLTVENLMDSVTLSYSNFHLLARTSDIYVTSSWSMSDNMELFAGTSEFILETNAEYRGHANSEGTICYEDTANNITINGTGVKIDISAYTGDNWLVCGNLTILEGTDVTLGSNSEGPGGGEGPGGEGPDSEGPEGHTATNMANFTIFRSIVNEGYLDVWTRINITGSSSEPLTGFGLFNGTIYLNGTATSHYIEAGLPTGTLYINRTLTINTTFEDSFRIDPSTEDYFPIMLLDFHQTSYGYLVRWNMTASASLDFNLTMAPQGYYKRYVNGFNEANLSADLGGWVNFTFSKNLSEAISLLLADENLTEAFGIPAGGVGGLVITVETIGMIVTLTLGFGTMLFGLVRRDLRALLLISGLVWIFGGIFFFTELHTGFTILSLGIGIILLMTTGIEYLEPQEPSQRIRSH